MILNANKTQEMQIITVMSHPNSMYSAELFSYIYTNWCEKIKLSRSFQAEGWLL